MDTSRDDVGIAIRSAFLKKGTNKDFLYLFLFLAFSIILFLLIQ